MNWDTRPLPAGWILGYDEETGRMCYFQYSISPPTISFVHPLDAATDMEEAGSSSPQESGRPLPMPPEAPNTQSQDVTSTLSSQPSSQGSPPPPFRSYAQETVSHNSSPPKLTPAQQLYARSLTKQTVAVSTVPSPSLRTEHSILRRENGGRLSLYKNSVASYTDQVPLLKARANPPRSSIVKVPQMHVFNPSEPSSAPPYSEINTFGGGSAHNNSPPTEFERDRPTSLPVYTRDQPDAEAHFRQPYSWDPMTRNNHYAAQPRSLFPPNYVPNGTMRPQEPKKITTAIKPPAPTDDARNVMLPPQHQFHGFDFSTADPMLSSAFSQPRPSISSPSQVPSLLLPPNSRGVPNATNSFTHLPIPSSIPPAVPPLHNVYQASNKQSHVYVQPQNPSPSFPSQPSSSSQPQSISPKSQSIFNSNNGNNVKPTKQKKPSNILGNFSSAINNALGRKSFDLGSSQNRPPPQPQPLQTSSLPPRPPVPLITTIDERTKDSQESDRELIESLTVNFTCLTNSGDTRSLSVSDEPPSAGEVSTSEALGFSGDPDSWNYDHSLLFQQHLPLPTTRPSSTARSATGTDHGTELPYTSFISFS